MKPLILLVLSSVIMMAEGPLRGFPPEEWPARRDLESRLRAVPSSERLREYVRRMSAEPHHAGSPGSKAVAEYALGLMKSWGLDARIEVFEALLPYPVKRSLEMVEPERYTAKLAEPAISEDPDSGDAGQLPTYNAYSGSGVVTAPLVYVNYGIPEDYEYLKQLGIDVRGKIVMARYGGSWRGTKPKVAAEHGAVGCLIYSDAKDDGFYQGDVYPKGAFRPPQGAQRGSVMDMPLYVGDPLSPGWASEPGSRRLSPDEAKTLMKIPVLPISYADAEPLLRNLGGPVAPENWRGALPLTYHLGPGPAAARLEVRTDMETRPVYDVLATIAGSEFPDEWVIYGNHHDAWVNGADDPASGAAALLETARALAELVKGGWKPKRTLVLALWDAEEFGLIGSTEWVEKHRDEIEAKAVAYLNTDSTGKGRLTGGASPTLDTFIREVARDVPDPVAKTSLLEAATPKPSKDKPEEKPEFRLGSLGAGSDYVAFVHHAGVASVNLTISGDSGGGIYHSIYDSFAWYSRFSDGQFVYGKAMAQVMATAVARLADAPVLPFEFDTLARAVRSYVLEIDKVAGKKSGRVSFDAVLGELKRVEKSAQRYEKQLAKAMKRAQGAPPEKLKQVNQALFRSERALLAKDGLPGREWYKNRLYAPGLYTGYSAKPLPAVREAVEAGRFDDADRYAAGVADALRTLDSQIRTATERLKDL